MSRTVEWERLPEPTRHQVEAQLGPVLKVEPITGGRNHQFAAILHTDAGAVFVKGLHTGDRRSHRQAVEAVVNPAVAGLAPRLRWHLSDAGGWHLLGFDAIRDARPADLTPGSDDLARIASVLRAPRGNDASPTVAIERIERRWGQYLDPAVEQLLAGDHLIHTDLRPDNVLITAGRVWIVDWAWPAHGASWVDPACLALWLVAVGHPPRDAERWLLEVTTRTGPTDSAIDAFVAADRRLWTEIAEQDPQPWKARLADAAARWLEYRGPSDWIIGGGMARPAGSPGRTAGRGSG